MKFRQFFIVAMLALMALSAQAETVGTIDINASGPQWIQNGGQLGFQRAYHHVAGRTVILVSYSGSTCSARAAFRPSYTSANAAPVIDSGYIVNAMVTGVTSLDECADHVFDKLLR